MDEQLPKMIRFGETNEEQMKRFALAMIPILRTASVADLQRFRIDLQKLYESMKRCAGICITLDSLTTHGLGFAGLLETQEKELSTPK